MKLKRFYELAVEIGREKDPRPKNVIDDELEKRKKDFDSLAEDRKALFDTEKLLHPYDDTRILNGDHNIEVQSVLAGIDISSGEVAAFDRLREKNPNINLLVSHHPAGHAWANFYEVMGIHSHILSSVGVSMSVGQFLLEQRKAEVKRKVMPANHFQAVDAARLLDCPWLCIHTPADNCANAYLTALFEKEQPKRVGDIIDVLMALPEYQESAKRGAAPVILNGKKEFYAGRILLEMTGGTEGATENYQHLAQHGISTIVGMHFSENHYKAAKAANLNLIVAGHIASDSLGLNILFDEIIKRSSIDINIMAFSGFIRVPRK